MAESATIRTLSAWPAPAATGASAPSPPVSATRLSASTGTGKTLAVIELVLDVLRRDRWRTLVESGQGIFKLSLPDETSAVEALDPRWLVEATEGTLLSVRNVMSVPFGISASTQRKLPGWWPDVEMQIASLMSLEVDWDSSGGVAPELSVLLEASALLGEVLRPTAVAPALVPLSDGAVQLEWHRRGADVEIIVGDVEDAGAFVSDRSGDWETPLDEPGAIEELAKRLDHIAAP